MFLFERLHIAQDMGHNMKKAISPRRRVSKTDRFLIRQFLVAAGRPFGNLAFPLSAMTVLELTTGHDFGKIHDGAQDLLFVKDAAF